ncbi:peptidylprolyl isomerase [Gordonia asplenii]|uniref:peptidylprolyl isomerase n=1 Tax=Gordonia asplenii TaxID=2725283 RepID=UPI0035E42679
MSTNDDGQEDKVDLNKPADTSEPTPEPAASTEPTSAALTNEERRQAAKAKLEQRLEADRQAARKRKLIIASVSTAVVVAIVATVTTVVVKKVLDDREAARWTNCTYANAASDIDSFPKTVPAGTPAAQQAEYQKQIDQINAVRDKQRKSPKPPAKELKSGTATWTLNTSQGVIPATLDRSGAPCNTNAIISLTDNKFFDATTCHRMTTSKTLQVLQCGDPAGIGLGNPGWSSPDEPPTNLKPGPTQNPMGGDQIVIYPRGTIAIANSNSAQMGRANTGGSQFFLVINDSQLPANYAVVGKVDDAGLAVLDKVYKGGIVPSGPDRTDDGKPKLPVEIKTATIS